ncbi:MAG: zf-HC2 domain-containing protein [Pseudomonadota bacterium]|uniref:zf-HC2 domain-containing protein n=1 Tax=Hylemonella sp. TaxID=2066020 RepID=UPI0035B49F33
MLSCKEVNRLLSEAQDRPLALRERLPLRLHLAMCQGCRNFEKQLDFLRQATRQFPGRHDDERGD